MLALTVFVSAVLAAVVGSAGAVVYGKAKAARDFPVEMAHGARANIDSKQAREIIQSFPLMFGVASGMPMMDILKHINGVRIRLHKPDAIDPLGRYKRINGIMVAGWLDTSDVVNVVDGARGPAALNHELIHYMLKRFTGDPDASHSTPGLWR